MVLVTGLALPVRSKASGLRLLEQFDLGFPALPRTCQLSCPLTDHCALAQLDFVHVFEAAVETKLGKNRTEAEVKRYTEEKERLEKEKEDIRSQLTQLRKQKRDLKGTLASCTGRITGKLLLKGTRAISVLMETKQQWARTPV